MIQRKAAIIHLFREANCITLILRRAMNKGPRPVCSVTPSRLIPAAWTLAVLTTYHFIQECFSHFPNTNGSCISTSAQRSALNSSSHPALLDILLAQSQLKVNSKLLLSFPLPSIHTDSSPCVQWGQTGDLSPTL
jgi:hypothetical protein